MRRSTTGVAKRRPWGLLVPRGTFWGAASCWL